MAKLTPCCDLNGILEILVSRRTATYIDPTFYEKKLIFAIYARILNQNLLHFLFQETFLPSSVKI